MKNYTEIRENIEEKEKRLKLIKSEKLNSEEDVNERVKSKEVRKTETELLIKEEMENEELFENINEKIDVKDALERFQILFNPKPLDQDEEIEVKPRKSIRMERSNSFM